MTLPGRCFSNCGTAAPRGTPLNTAKALKFRLCRPLWIHPGKSGPWWSDEFHQPGIRAASLFRLWLLNLQRCQINGSACWNTHVQSGCCGCGCRQSFGFEFLQLSRIDEMCRVQSGDFRPSTANHNCCAFIEANSQQLRVLRDDREQIRLTAALAEVLVNRCPGQKCKSPLVAFRHHHGIPQWTASHQKFALNRGAGRAGWPGR